MHHVVHSPPVTLVTPPPGFPHPWVVVPPSLSPAPTPTHGVTPVPSPVAACDISPLTPHADIGLTPQQRSHSPLNFGIDTELG